jgi:hypothetical protein
MNKEFNRNYKNFHKATIMGLNTGISKPQSYRQQTKIRENTTHLHKIKFKNNGRRNKFNCTTEKFSIPEVNSNKDHRQ